MKSRVQKWFTAISVSAVALGAGLSVWFLQLDREIQTRFAQGRFAPPIEFYSAPQVIRRGQKLRIQELIGRLVRQGYRQRAFGETLQEVDYSLWSGSECKDALPARQTTPESDASSAMGSLEPEDAAIAQCLAFRHSRSQVFRAGFFLGEGSAADSTDPDASTNAAEPVQILVFDANQLVTGIYSGVNPRPTEVGVLTPELFAQYLGPQPILRKEVEFSAVPNMCKWAVLAIEDPAFLDHAGVSALSILRAAFANLKAGRFAQGGSTITQQLVKNYFLTQEKTLSRKLKEFAMSLILENRISKEKILETYLNVIYMGQSGAFEVRGLGAAALHYFDRPLDLLSLHECALLAATLNSPGTYNPFKQPDRTLQRRNRVLEKMVQHGFADADLARAAQAQPLPQSERASSSETAPYFVKTARLELSRLGIDTSNGLRVFTTLNPDHQEAAKQAVIQGLKRLEARPGSQSLEAALISADPQTGFITAVVGGRGYVETQFNRAVEANRQVGSLMKPIVFLSAFENLKVEDLDPINAPSGRVDQPRHQEGPIDSTTLLADLPITVKYDGQTWSPKNYDGKSRGAVPAWYALAHSLNQATAWLAQQVGPKSIVSTSRALGVTAPLDAVPSIALGAFEMSPLEMLKVFVVLARMGSQIPLSTLLRVEDLNGAELHSFRSTEEQVAEADSTALIVSMLEQAVIQGTARQAANKLPLAAAGKTGTTNEKKDSWFAGFTPETVAVVWVGSDKNQPTGLTGASGALPIWLEFMSQSTLYSTDSSLKPTFNYPDSVKAVLLGGSAVVGGEEPQSASSALKAEPDAASRSAQLEPRPLEPTEIRVRVNRSAWD